MGGSSALPSSILSRSAYNQRAIGKVKPGVTAGQLNAEMATLSRQLSATYPEDKTKALEAVPLQEQIVGKIRPILRLLMASVGVVLLIVCANIAHLQLVRATRLRREVTIRSALGATRLTLARRAALEVVLLAVAGCMAGVMVAVPALKLLIRLAPPEIPRLGDVRLNLDVIAFSFLVSVLTMAVTALLPLWRSWRVDPATAMKQDAARGLESRGSGRLRQGLIVAEVALTLMLSVAATLLVRQMIAESRQDLGFAPEKLVMLDMHMISAPNGAADVQTLNRIVESASGVPGVAGAAAIAGAPMSAGIADVRYAVHGVSEFKPGAVGLPDANIAGVTPNYFETMQIPLLQGRGLSNADRDGSEPVLLVSESAARQSFPGTDPIGRQVMFSWDSEPALVHDRGRSGRCAAGFAGVKACTNVLRPDCATPETGDGYAVDGADAYRCRGDNGGDDAVHDAPVSPSSSAGRDDARKASVKVSGRSTFGRYFLAALPG